MDEIIVKKDVSKMITVIKRSVDSLHPNSVYVQIKNGDNYCYLEENELHDINKSVKLLKK